MTTLVSPGVLVTVTDESFSGTAGPGTRPLVVFASAANKLQSGSTTSIAPGSLTANAGNLYLLTSQSSVLSTFGTPTFYNIDGTPQYDNELNEFGLLALYQYLGQANTAFALRASIDLNQLIPTPTAPTGPLANGTYWLNLASTTWGIFESNGNINSAYAWEAKTPLIISNAGNLESVVQGYNVDSWDGYIIDTTAPAFEAGYANYKFVVNNYTVLLNANDTLSTIVNKINNNASITNYGLTASIFTRTGVYGYQLEDGNLVGDIYSLRITSNNINWYPDFTGSNPNVLSALGITVNPTPVICPADSFGEDGNFAVDTISIDADNTAPSNRLWQKITLTTSATTTAWWFQVGSTDTQYPGWGWREANPRTITGVTPNPVFYSTQNCQIAFGEGTPITMTVPGLAGNVASLQSWVNAINASFSGEEEDDGYNATASILKVGRLGYLVITNYDGTDTWFHDDDSENGLEFGNAAPWFSAGISTSQTYYGSVTGIVANPTFVAATLDLASANVAVAGNAYAVGNVLAVVGGTYSQFANVSVSSLQVTNAVAQTAGTGYAVNDTLTFSGANYTTPVILTVGAVTAGAISNLVITQSGQYVGNPPPTYNVSPTTQVTVSGSDATVTFDWGVGTVSVVNGGNYTAFPTSPTTATGGTGSGVELSVTPGFLTSNDFSINAGAGNVIINVPAAPNNTLDGVVNAINAAFPYGPIVANVVIDGAFDYLQITNQNGTQLTLQEISGTPLNSAGINVGYTFGTQLVYQGYTPLLTVPSGPNLVAPDNIWINTTPTDRGLNIILNRYVDGTFIPQNSNPNTQNIPVYLDNSYANSGFGAQLALSSIYAQYNVTGANPPLADMMLNVYQSTLNQAPIWEQLTYVPDVLPPAGPPAAGTLWYDDNIQYEFLVSDGQIWQGYRVRYPATDINGPILSASQPVSQSTGAPLVDSDIWVNTSVQNYFTAWRFDGTNQLFVELDDTDNITPAGIIFQDARASADGTLTGPTDIQALLLSNTVDPDCPNALFYPAGMLLMNTRWSSNNVKQWNPNWFPNRTVDGVADTARWVTVSGNDPEGAPYIGSTSQRILVVESLASAIASSTAARAEQNFFNLMATPGYVEVLEDMVNMNIDKDYVFFIIGDPPIGLPPDGTSIQNYATNAADVAADGPDGLTTADPYAGLWYPWVLTTNLDGREVLVPPSTSILQVMAYNDQVAYPWFAPAGFNRGLLTNANSVGYLLNGEYQPLILNQGERDVLYTNNINPIAYFPNRGIVVYGQKTLNPISTSALSRVNIARLINYLSYNLNIIALPFLFEQNDAITRANVVNVFNGFMGTLITARALYDFAVVCDTSNNTPTTIDENQLFIDVAIQPEITIEFIYIPILILATGAPLPSGSSG